MAAVSTAVQRSAPVYRRKMSITDSELRPRASPGSDRHQRSVTDGSSANGHPLVRDRARHVKGGSEYDYDLLEADVGVTRPALDRRVDELTQPVIAVDGAEPVDEEEKDLGQQLLVLVHQVQAKDSLAGVALRYGISIADLRRANQLWFSDSIHLRKTLYIPLNQATQSTSKHLLIDLSTPASETPSDATSSCANGDATAEPSRSSSSLSANIQRIPASKLSFFPPPSQRKPQAIPSPGSKGGDYFTPRTPSSQRPNGALSSPFGSILTAVAGRVSIDSTSSGERSEEVELELRDTTRRKLHTRSSTTTNERTSTMSTSPPGPGSYWRRKFDTVVQNHVRPRGDTTELIDLFSGLSHNNDPPEQQKSSTSTSPPSLASSSSRTITGSSRTISGTAPYRDTDRDRDVDLPRSRRTVQLEPSPMMRVQLPPPGRGPGTGKSHASGAQTMGVRGAKGGRRLEDVFGDLWGEERDSGGSASEGTLI